MLMRNLGVLQYLLAFLNFWLLDWLHSAMGQAIREAEDRSPIVYLHERHMKFEDGYVVLRAKDFKSLCPIVPD